MNGSIRQRVRWVTTRLLGIAVAAIVTLLVLHYIFGIPQSPEQEIWIIIVVASTIFVVGFMRVTRFTEKIADQVDRMTAVSREISRGDLERKIDTAQIPLEELRELAEAINAMSTRAKLDIAEMKRLERVRSEFLGNVSHELRTPIFSVQGYLETLIDGAVEDPEVRDDFLHKAHQNVLRLHSLLTDLIEISRIESGEMKMSFRYFNAVEYFRAIIDELQPTAEMADVELEFHIVGSPKNGSISVLGDRDRLKQAIVNLIENAIKYNHPGGVVSIELEPGATEAIVRVRDTGIGIPKEDLGRIFERFYRVNKDRSRAVGGSGLGLAIVKHIIEAHGSTVQVESQLGTGTTFSFRLKQ